MPLAALSRNIPPSGTFLVEGQTQLVLLQSYYKGQYVIQMSSWVLNQHSAYQLLGYES